MMEVLIYVWPVVAIIAALTEAYFDAKGKVTEHAISAAVRVVIAGTIAWWMFTPYYAVVYGIILLNCFWIVFDPFYNIIRDGNVWYIGDTAKLDKLARNWFKEEGGASYLMVKLSLMVWLLIAYSL